MTYLRPSEERGHVNIGWLDSRHSFSFGHYYDPVHPGFGALRVINEDRVQPGEGFGTHGHQDMEIISYVLDGALEHKDSLGNGSVMRPGELQRMTAGSGIRHSEFNSSKTEPLHFLQIWLHPEKEGLEPDYEQKEFPAAERQDRLRLMASYDGREGSLTIHQDVELYGALLAVDRRLSFNLRSGRQVWVQLVRGTLKVDDQQLYAGDGLGLTDPGTIQFTATDDTEFLLFDLAA